MSPISDAAVQLRIDRTDRTVDIKRILQALPANSREH